MLSAAKSTAVFGGSRRSTLACAAASSAMSAVRVKEVAKGCPLLPRSGACGAPLPPGHASGASAILLTGYVETPDKARAATNEAWVYEAGGDGAGSWSLVPYAEGPAPGPRIAAQAVLVGEDVWLIGGWDPSKQGPAAFLDDVWKLSTKDWSWTQITPAGIDALGGGVSRHQALAVGNLIYVHSHRCSDHIVELDTKSNVMRKVPLKGDPAAGGGGPAARGLHSVTRVGDALLLFGGAPQSGPMMDDLWRLDLASKQWTRLAPGGTHPHVRCSHIAADAGSGRLLVVGGAFYGASGGLQMLGDAFIYDSTANDWQPVTPAGGDLPSPRNAAVGVPLPAAAGGLRLLIHGGWRAFVESYADTFELSV